MEASHQQQLSHEQTAALVVDMLHRTMLHHVLWYTEVCHQMGQERALEMLFEVFEQASGIQLKHLGNALGFECKGNIPQPLLDLSPEKLAALKDRVAKNWLVTDGVWFQAVESREGMNDAKRCNDTCWARFSPVEAGAIRRFLGLDRHCGLAGLKRALGFRLYAGINEQSIVDEGDGSFIFRMDKCRVQEARRRKGLPDYPCKSAGMVEYTYFARSMDERIQCECVACPPDEHPEEWYCAWRFSLRQTGE